jgi:peptidoglycan/xylan/chitin deacetylase (PgdA/CDA1 family)
MRPRGRSSAILMYHSLDDSGSVVSTSPASFLRQMEWLHDQHVPVVALEQVTTTPGSMAITFDDGLVNFVEHGLPVLERRGYPATLFVVSDGCGGTSSWSRVGQRLPVLDWNELEAIPADLVEIGSHTASHPDLCTLSRREIDQELQSSRAAIEDRLGRAVTSLAYPYGASNPLVRDVTQHHYERACGTTLRYVDGRGDPLDLPRIDTFYLRRAFWFERVMRRVGRGYLGVRRRLREVDM